MQDALFFLDCFPHCCACGRNNAVRFLKDYIDKQKKYLCSFTKKSLPFSMKKNIPAALRKKTCGSH